MKFLIITIFSICSIIPFQLNGQKSNLSITEIGGLFEDNLIGYDGGLLSFQLKVLSEKVNFKRNKIKLKGQVFDQNQTSSAFNIYLGYRDLQKNKLVIIDTLYSFPFGETITIFNKKRLNNSLNGIFKIQSLLEENNALYIEYVGFRMLEIKIKK